MAETTRVLDQLHKALRQPRGLARLARNLYLDVKFGGRFLGGHIASPAGARSDHTGTGNTDYAVLARMFSEVRLAPDDVFVDVGCGKGRTFNWLLQQGCRNRLVGIELVPEVAEFTRRRLRRYPQIEIVTGDIRERLPEGTVYYLFNPFGEETMRVFAAKLSERLRQPVPGRSGKRPVILYTRCDHVGVFEENPAWRVRQFDLSAYACRRGAIIEPA
jgi:SAM-dependent methyltransferase